MQDQDGATIGLRLILTERHFDLKTGVLKLECTASIAGRTQNYFTRSHEVMAALIYPTPVYVDPMRPTQRSAKSSKDSRSASYSSGYHQFFKATKLIKSAFLFPYKKKNEI